MCMLARGMQQAYVTLCDESVVRFPSKHAQLVARLYIRGRGLRIAVLAKVLGLSLSY
jgi:hypothetical protein